MLQVFIALGSEARVSVGTCGQGLAWRESLADAQSVPIVLPRGVQNGKI